eukprot:TRINITY_DN55111_c0_g1_i1.p1 TRINITY_DN55111_c0_g1~~TRINITY_DN55111_c0_g1_i1.p1  ORF type:complete len:368 (+),score=107.44 TRINITY_DN55111_c0_g1_i1:116-1105(+)
MRAPAARSPVAALRRAAGAQGALPTRQIRRFGRHDMGDEAYRRPENSSWSYRSVQDWKPMIQKVAHLAGRDEPPDDSERVTLHMTLVDHQGFRWPVRFTPWSGMVLWDVINMTDQVWFDMYANAIQLGDCKHVRAGEVNYQRCQPGQPSFWDCDRCVVTLPYEYLDAMAPPEIYEVSWMQRKLKLWSTFLTANCRLSCQVFIEDWMDGMTIVLPQKDSLAYQMYVQSNTDKETMDQVMGMGIRYPGGPNGEGYLWREPGGPGTKYPENALEAVMWRDDLENLDKHPSGQYSAGKGAALPLRDIFWHDFIDDVIREVDPKHEGRYRFMKQ